MIGVRFWRCSNGCRYSPRFHCEQSSKQQKTHKHKFRSAWLGNFSKRHEIGAMRAHAGENRRYDHCRKVQNSKLIPHINVHRPACEPSGRDLVNRIPASIGYEKVSAGCIRENRIVRQTSNRFSVGSQQREERFGLRAQPWIVDKRDFLVSLAS